ncbi:hypothetical protein [uncultured Alsobacter sp.]|uniref:hypothetical protein n=1 Tax=uncultured Alsobacter sp. TaxID=1748258 RepID=UPI0025D6AE49|nr:hypothetical protein [uncultured Alsobacter sp.]
MRRSFCVLSSAIACVVLLSNAGYAASRKPTRTVEPAKVATAKPAPVRQRSALFAADTPAVATTATVAGARPGCGSIACKNYTIMGVGF